MGKQTRINSDGSCRHGRVSLNGQEHTDEGGQEEAKQETPDWESNPEPSACEPGDECLLSIDIFSCNAVYFQS